jgi:hypothetical protein
LESYYACGFGRKFRSGRRIELKYPSDAVPMIVEYLDDRYEVYEWLEGEDGEWTRMPLRFGYRDYDSEKGYVRLVDCWGETVAEVAVVCEEYDIYWSWVERWAEELFELTSFPSSSAITSNPPSSGIGRGTSLGWRLGSGAGKRCSRPTGRGRTAELGAGGTRSYCRTFSRKSSNSKKKNGHFGG